MIGVYFSLKERMVYIYRETIRELGTPAYIRLLINPDKRKFAIEACRFGDPGYCPTPELDGSRGSYRISHTNLLRQIWQLCEWDVETTYRIPGVVYSNDHVAEFCLDDAEPVNTGG